MNQLETVTGHNRQKNLLKRQLENNQLSHAYLFDGPKGVGKKLLAQNFAVEVIKSGLIDKNRNISINHADIFEYGQKKENIKISDVRQLISETITKPLEGSNRVFIIDHADYLNPIAQNALLKTIEEPSAGNIFILITDKPTNLLPTIRSRCQELPFHDLSDEEKIQILKENGIADIPDDLSSSPGELIKNCKNPEKIKKLQDFYEKFNKILKGDTIELFNLAEQVSKDKAESVEILEYLIKRLSNTVLENSVPDGNILFIIDQLFELLEKLSYNVNTRLQWESCLIKIISELENEKTRRRS